MTHTGLPTTQAFLSRTLLMAPKRKDANKKGVPSSPAPTPAPLPTAPSPPSLAASPKPVSWWLRRVFRLFALISVALYVWPRVFPKPKEADLAEEEGRNVSEPIVLDKEKRGAILDAFKVSNGTGFSDRDLTGSVVVAFVRGVREGCIRFRRVRTLPLGRRTQLILVLPR